MFLNLNSDYESAHWDAIQRDNEEYAERYREAHYFDFDALTPSQVKYIKKSWEALKAEFVEDMAIEMRVSTDDTRYNDFADNILDFAEGYRIDTDREV